MNRQNGTRGIRYNFHASQRRAWDSKKRIVAIIAGVRSGKTSFGSPWLHREMISRGPGDYLVVAPDYQLLDKGAAPEIEFLFQRVLRLGELKRNPFQFHFSDSGCKALWGQVPERRARIIFGHADAPESLAAMTVKGAWLDECGQKKFKLESWEEIQRRLSFDQGRALLSTTPYNLGWLKKKVYDPWIASGRSHHEIELISFSSLENPAFPRAEWERAKASLPRWKFDMFYRGLFVRPAGLIYDCFDEDTHLVRRFAIPEVWPRLLGLDFGGVNTAGIFFAEEMAPGPYHPERKITTTKTGRLFAYREYKAGGRTAKDHAKALLQGEPTKPYPNAGEPRIPLAVGGSKSEDQWRNEFAAGGLPVHGPSVTEVEVGIDRVYGAIKRGEILVFDDLAGLREELVTYSRELDEMGEPTEVIEDKDTFHFCDSVRYIIGRVKGGQEQPQHFKASPLRKGY